MNPICYKNGFLHCSALRLGPGQEIVECLREFVKRQNLKSAFIITCVGSVREAVLRMAESGIHGQNLEVKQFEKHFEIVSLVGTVSKDGELHLHASLSDNEGNVIGGHVVRNFYVHTTAEIVIGSLPDVEFSRQLDSQTGWNELDIS